MARAVSSDTVGTTETCFFRSNRKYKSVPVGTVDTVATGGDGTPFRAIRVNVDSASAASLLVRIPFLHGSTASTNQCQIVAGSFREFVTQGVNRDPEGDELFLQGSGGTATFTFEIIA